MGKKGRSGIGLAIILTVAAAMAALAGLLAVSGQEGIPSGVLAGIVVDDTTGAPLADASVTALATSSEGEAYTATTGVDGTYSIADVEPANYDIAAQKVGYDPDFRGNVPIMPFKTSTVDFRLVPATEGPPGGAWVPPTATMTGRITNVSGEPVADAMVNVLGTGLSAATAIDGTYTITDIPAGTYDIVAGKPADGYEDATAMSTELFSGTASVDLVLLRGLGYCSDDCATGGSNFCSASCQGKGLCWFDSSETMDACDGTFGMIELPGSRYVDCCKGKPYAAVKADTVVPSKNVIVTKRPVLYKGRIVNLVITVFNE